MFAKPPNIVLPVTTLLTDQIERNYTIDNIDKYTKNKWRLALVITVCILFH